MYDMIILVLFTFSILIRLQLLNIMRSFMLLGINIFIVVAFRPVDGSEFHSESARFMWSMPKN